MGYENIKPEAEQSTRKWNTVVLILCILLFIALGIFGIILISDWNPFSAGTGIDLIIFSIFGIVSSLLFSSLIDTITNISVKLDKLDDMQRTLKKMENNQDRLTRHLDN